MTHIGQVLVEDVVEAGLALCDMPSVSRTQSLGQDSLCAGQL